MGDLRTFQCKVTAVSKVASGKHMIKIETDDDLFAILWVAPKDSNPPIVMDQKVRVEITY